MADVRQVPAEAKVPAEGWTGAGLKPLREPASLPLTAVPAWASKYYLTVDRHGRPWLAGYHPQSKAWVLVQPDSWAKVTVGVSNYGVETGKLKGERVLSNDPDGVKKVLGPDRKVGEEVPLSEVPLSPAAFGGEYLPWGVGAALTLLAAWLAHRTWRRRRSH